MQEVLPALTAVLAAPQRPMASSLLTPAEAATRRELVSTMLDYGLTFALGNSHLVAGEGECDVMLSPPVQQVTLFQVGRLLVTLGRLMRCRQAFGLLRGCTIRHGIAAGWLCCWMLVL